jgi:hypothetical protein
MTQAEHMDPHKKLEFVQMTICTKAIDFGLRLRREDRMHSVLNDQINKNNELLSWPIDENSQNTLVADLERF